MKPEEILLTAVASAACTALLTGFLAFVFQSWIGQWFSKKLEVFRKDLNRDAFEHETRFSKLHEERARVIAELYKKLIRAERALNEYTISFQTLLEDWNDLTESDDLPEDKRSESSRYLLGKLQLQYRKAKQAVEIADSFYEENEIWLPSPSWQPIARLWISRSEAEINLPDARLLDTEQLDPESVERMEKSLKDVSEALDVMRQAKGVVRKEFRAILGND